MAAEVGSVFISLDANLTGLNAGFREGEKRINSFGGTLTGFSRKVDGVVGRSVLVLKDRTESLVNSAGAAGMILRGLGPAGLIAGAVIGGTALAFTEFNKRARDAVEALGDLQDKAQLSGLSTDAFQGLQFAAAQAGVSADKFSEAMAKFAASSGQAREGTGELYNSIRNISQTLANDFRRASDQGERFKIVLAAIAKLNSDAQRANLAQTAFGRGGLSMVRALNEIGDAGGLNKVIDAAKQAGQVVDAELIQKAEKLGDELDAAATITKNNLNAAFASVATSSGFVKLEQWTAQMSIAARKTAEMLFAPMSDQSSDSLDDQIAKAREYQRLLKDAVASSFDPQQATIIAGSFTNAFKKQFNQGLLEGINEYLNQLLDASVTKARSRLAEAMKRGPQGDPFAGFRDMIDIDPVPSRPATRDPELEAKIERDRLRERVSALGNLASAQDRARLRELELSDAVKHGSVSQSEATRIVDAARLAIDEQTTALRERLGVATETERIAIKERELDQAVQAGTISLQDRTKALDIYKRELAETVKYEPVRLSDTPQLTRLSIEASDLRAELDTELSGALRGIGSDLVAMAEGTEKASDGLANMAKKIAEAVAQALIMRTVVGPLASGLAGALGSAFSTGPTMIAAPYAGGALVPTFHSGGIAGGPAPRRAVSMSIFAGAPRFHAGGSILGAGELPAILQRGERVLTRAQDRQASDVVAGLSALAAKEAIGGGHVEVNIQEAPGASVGSVKQSGGRLDIVLKGIVEDTMISDIANNGRVSQTLFRRTGLKPRI